MAHGVLVPGRLLKRAAVLLLMLPCAGRAIRTARIASPHAYMQESEAGAPLGKLQVETTVMASRCITMVSPHYPPGLSAFSGPQTVVIRVVIFKSGTVRPVHLVSGKPQLEAEAMNALRLWRYKPFTRDGVPVDVTTEVRVDFDPHRPAGMITHPVH